MAEGLILREQRLQSRRELIYYLKIVEVRTRQELGRLGDLHTRGMLILGESPLTPGDSYEVALELPKALAEEYGRKYLFLSFETAWTHPGPKNTTFHESGVSFINTDPDTQEVISRLIDSFAMPADRRQSHNQ